MSSTTHKSFTIEKVIEKIQHDLLVLQSIVTKNSQKITQLIKSKNNTTARVRWSRPEVEAASPAERRPSTEDEVAPPVRQLFPPFQEEDLEALVEDVENASPDPPQPKARHPVTFPTKKIQHHRSPPSSPTSRQTPTNHYSQVTPPIKPKPDQNQFHPLTTATLRKIKRKARRRTLPKQPLLFSPIKTSRNDSQRKTKQEEETKVHRETDKSKLTQTDTDPTQRMTYPS